jgi:hypothetical protein
MADMSVEVPGALVAPLRETVVLLYQATAEALHHALRAHGEGGSLGEVDRHRARLADLEAMLEQLGWAPGPARGDLELNAPPEVLHDAVYGALIDAGERLAAACSSSWSGRPETEDVHALATQVIALDRLLRRIEMAA